MKRILINAIGLYILASASVLAANGTWNPDSSGVWMTPTWLDGVIADEAGATGNFTFNITAGRTVTIDTTARTLGVVNIGDSTAAAAVYEGVAIGGPKKGPELFGMGTFTVLSSVPEPATYMLLGLGALVCVQQFRRSRKA